MYLLNDKIILGFTHSFSERTNKSNNASTMTLDYRKTMTCKDLTTLQFIMGGRTKNEWHE